MKCKCGGELEVVLIEAVAVLKCSTCGRGELIPQSKPHEVFDHRARVSQATEAKTTVKKSK
jgi:signal transduction histidine kinase